MGVRDTRNSALHMACAGSSTSYASTVRCPVLTSAWCYQEAVRVSRSSWSTQGPRQVSRDSNQHAEIKRKKALRLYKLYGVVSYCL